MRYNTEKPSRREKESKKKLVGTSRSSEDRDRKWLNGPIEAKRSLRGTLCTRDRQG